MQPNTWASHTPLYPMEGASATLNRQVAATPSITERKFTIFIRPMLW